MHLVYGGGLVSVVNAVRWDYQIEVLYYLDRDSKSSPIGSASNRYLIVEALDTYFLIYYLHMLRSNHILNQVGLKTKLQLS